MAIDQRGQGKNLAETRLYVYPETDTKTLHQITIGDKNSQPGDVQLSHEYVEQLKRGKDADGGQQQDTGDKGKKKDAT